MIVLMSAYFSFSCFCIKAEPIKEFNTWGQCRKEEETFIPHGYFCATENDARWLLEKDKRHEQPDQ